MDERPRHNIDWVRLIQANRPRRQTATVYGVGSSTASSPWDVERKPTTVTQSSAADLSWARAAEVRVKRIR